MSKVDTAWLRMDSSSNLMMINGVWTCCKPGISLRSPAASVQSACCSTRAFASAWSRTPPVPPGWRTSALTSKPMCSDRRCPGKPRCQPAGGLQEFVGDLAMKPLDRGARCGSSTWWRITRGQPGSALVVRLHHCIADGIALISVTMSLVDGGAEPPNAASKAAPAKARGLDCRHADQALHRA
jgi:diacylglycerol O-acyltransferase